MEPRIKNALLSVQEAGPLAAMYAAGLTPHDVKEAVVELLAPYSSNHEALRRYAIEFMVADAVSVVRVETSEWATQLLVESVRLRRESLAADRGVCLQRVAASQRNVQQSISTYWSHLHLARDLRTLALEEFAHETLRYLGTLIEGVSKVFLYELASHSELARGRGAQAAAMEAQTLGHVLDVLERAAGSEETYRRHGIRLNQWRNVAQHFSTQVTGAAIHVRNNHGEQLAILTREEFENLLYDVMNAFRALSVAHTVFFFDHLDEMRAGGYALDAGEVRPEAAMVALAVALASQGFELVHADFGEKVAILVVRDQTDLETMSRQIHASQFVMPVYRHAPADLVEVEYRRRDGTPTFRATATRDLLERARANPAVLARESRYFDLLTGSEIPPSPPPEDEADERLA